MYVPSPHCVYVPPSLHTLVPICHLFSRPIYVRAHLRLTNSFSPPVFHESYRAQICLCVSGGKYRCLRGQIPRCLREGLSIVMDADPLSAASGGPSVSGGLVLHSHCWAKTPAVQHFAIQRCVCLVLCLCVAVITYR